MQVARNHYKEMDGIPETPDNSDVKTKMKKKTKLLGRKNGYQLCSLQHRKKVIKMPTVKEDSPQEVEETNNSKW